MFTMFMRTYYILRCYWTTLIIRQKLFVWMHNATNQNWIHQNYYSLSWMDDVMMWNGQKHIISCKKVNIAKCPLEKRFFLSETFCYLLISKTCLFFHFYVLQSTRRYLLFVMRAHYPKCELFIFWFCQGCNSDVLTN